MRAITIAFVVLLSVGCANPYTKFYTGFPTAATVPGLQPQTDSLRIFSAGNVEASTDELLRRGYALIGESSWNGPSSGAPESSLRAHASRIGAHLVLISSRYTNTVSGAVPLSMPTTSTTTTTVVGTVGSTPVTGTGVSTTSGTQTVMYPYSVDRADFNALYFVKVRVRLGIYVAPLDDAARQAIESNSGLRVRIVVEGSPAFDADILPGDILLAIQGERVASVERFQQLIRVRDGLPTEFTLHRGGRVITKTVTLLTL